MRKIEAAVLRTATVALATTAVILALRRTQSVEAFSGAEQSTIHQVQQVERSPTRLDAIQTRAETCERRMSWTI
jgi:hypothetical protein